MENKVLNQLPQIILTLVAMYLAFNNQYNPAFFLIGLAILNNLREINNK
jgi:hypothetical protein